MGQNAEGTGDILRETEDRLGIFANGLRSSYEEQPLIRQPLPLRASTLMLFGHRAVPHFVEDVGTPQKRKSAYMRFGKRSYPDVEGSISLAPAETVADTVPAMDKRKSAYMRFGKRNALIDIGLLSDASIAATLNRNMARMRFGRR